MTGTASEIVSYLMGQDREKVWDIEEHKDKRSLRQNAYYWQLITKVAAKLRISTSRLHNLMLRDADRPLVIGGKVQFVSIPDTDEAEEDALESTTFHVQPTSKTTVGEKGTVFRWYRMLRGSHDMNTEEFSFLVDLLIEEAKQQGIETITPAELARMRELEKGYKG